MSSVSGISLQNVLGGAASTNDSSCLGEFYIEDGQGGQKMPALKPRGFVLGAILARLALIVILLLVALVVWSTQVSPQRGVSFTRYQRYDRSCSRAFPSNTNLAVKDASCAGDLVCARNGFEDRHFGDCKGHHCCSLVWREAHNGDALNPWPKTDAAEALVRSLVGKWAPALEDDSAWMSGLKIADDGSFECSSGRITDGLVRVLSVPDRVINLKRTRVGANDHVFRVDEDAGCMLGQWQRSPTKITLTKVSDSRVDNLSI